MAKFLKDVVADRVGEVEAPKVYEFTATDVEVEWNAIHISWAVKGMGYGNLSLTTSDNEIQVDTEKMSEAFVEALLIEVAPKLAKALLAKEKGNI